MRFKRICFPCVYLFVLMLAVLDAARAEEVEDNTDTMLNSIVNEYRQHSPFRISFSPPKTRIRTLTHIQKLLIQKKIKENFIERLKLWHAPSIKFR